MIAIVNVDKNLRPTGQHKYELRINRKVIATFTHFRENGLAECLRRAMEAAEATDTAKRERIIKKIIKSGEKLKW